MYFVFNKSHMFVRLNLVANLMYYICKTIRYRSLLISIRNYTLSWAAYASTSEQRLFYAIPTMKYLLSCSNFIMRYINL